MCETHMHCDNIISLFGIFVGDSFIVGIQAISV